MVRFYDTRFTRAIVLSASLIINDTSLRGLARQKLSTYTLVMHTCVDLHAGHVHVCRPTCIYTYMHVDLDHAVHENVRDRVLELENCSARRMVSKSI